MTNNVNVREIVLDMLIDMEKNGTPSHILERETLAKYQYLDKSNRAFITRVFEGTIENKIRLDYTINSFSNTKTNKMKPLIRCLLRMSTYQIMFMDKTPDSAVCNEAVTIANKRGFRTLKGFVNGVLRNISRNKDNIEYPDINTDKFGYLSICYSTPEWIIEQISNQYGEDRLESILLGMNRKKEGVSLRISKKAEKAEVIKSLKDSGITVEELQLYDRGILIKGFDYLEKLEAFKSGKLIPQDESSMLVAHIADPRSCDMVIDVCAAPGGKSIHIAELLEGTGMVEARDVSEDKIMLIEENIRRIGVENIRTKVFNGSVEDEDAIESADIVVADVPCSGLGVISKKSDIKYNMSLEKQEELIKLQRAILKEAVKYVKKGGKLIFSTCTTNRNENIENMKWLMEEYKLQSESISQYLPKGFHGGETKNGYIQLLPDEDKTDGFFICKLIKQV